jgi:hypothetical protein
MTRMRHFLHAGPERVFYESSLNAARAFVAAAYVRKPAIRQ